MHRTPGSGSMTHDALSRRQFVGAMATSVAATWIVHRRPHPSHRRRSGCSRGAGRGVHGQEPRLVRRGSAAAVRRGPGGSQRPRRAAASRDDELRRPRRRRGRRAAHRARARAVRVLRGGARGHYRRFPRQPGVRRQRRQGRLEADRLRRSVRVVPSVRLVRRGCVTTPAAARAAAGVVRCCEYARDLLTRSAYTALPR